MEDTLLIVGRSPIVDEYSEHINYLCEIYPSIGINSIATVFNTKYCAFVDIGSFKVYMNKLDKSKELITLEKYIPLSEIYKCHLYNTFRPRNSDNTKDLVINENGDLAYFGFTHDLCISWAISNKFKNVVLLGAADFCADIYADINANVYTPIFIRNDEVEHNSINAIENFYSKHINIYAVNKNSKLKIPRITLEELYKKRLTNN